MKPDKNKKMKNTEKFASMDRIVRIGKERQKNPGRRMYHALAKPQTRQSELSGRQKRTCKIQFFILQSYKSYPSYWAHYFSSLVVPAVLA